MTNILKTILQCIILYIHLFTRTQAILVFYVIAFFGIFGEKSKASSTCFIIFLTTIFLNIILVLLFNSRSTKQSCIELVGLNFYNKYLSHSTVAAKSLTRLLAPTSMAYAYDLTSGHLKDKNQREIIRELRADIEAYSQQRNRKLAEETQRLVNTMEKNYVYGGNITQHIRQVSSNNVKESIMKNGASVMKSIFGKND